MRAILAPLAHCVGDRVVREEDVYARNSPLLHGVVVAVYGYDAAWPWLDHPSYIRENYSPGIWRYPELYDVLWDGGRLGKSYFPYGINKEN